MIEFEYLIVVDERPARGVLADVVERVVLAQPQALACLAAVDQANQRPWRAFEKAGFTYARDIEEEGRPHCLMPLDRGYAQ